MNRHKAGAELTGNHQPRSHPGGTEPTPSQQRLAQLLAQHGFIASMHVNQVIANAAATGRTVASLAEAGIPSTTLASAASVAYGLPIVRLEQTDQHPDLLARWPADEARRFLAIPTGRLRDGTAVFAVADPEARDLSAAITARMGESAVLEIADATALREFIAAVYATSVDASQQVSAYELVHAPGESADSGPQSAEIAAAPVVRVVDQIIEAAVDGRASDIHFEPVPGGFRIRYRIDGVLIEALRLPAAMGEAVVRRIKILAQINIVETRRPQDGKFTVTHHASGGAAIDLRVAVIPSVRGEKAVLRLLHRGSSFFSLEELGMPPDLLEAYRALIRTPHGLVICAGPTGSGKTTTLYASLLEVNEIGRNLVTVEDPVERLFDSVTQVQVDTAADVTFSHGLKALLRQDPDVILVGEIRDSDTARMAMESALTGHLVLSSLHGMDAAAALHRLLSMGLESFAISSVVSAVIGQRLVRLLCPRCTTRHTLTREEVAFAAKASMTPDVFDSYRGVGCGYCQWTGYRGRVGVYEVLIMTEAMEELVLRGASASELRELAVNQGMVPLQRAALELAAAGRTTVHEVIRTVGSL
ncbi:MAG: ATPase, T2SS/T4P/T4SS family [Candidatus Nanopelagicales bacterium]|nr:ATPase, T2SS/T4P/T4SS family [Candidatus Nanopelagicales bacterium]